MTNKKELLRRVVKQMLKEEFKMDIANNPISPEQIRQYEHEIEWLKKQIASGKITPKQKKEYERQIRHKELTMAFNSPKSMKEDVHKIAGHLSLYSQGLGQGAARIRFEDTKTSESISVHLDKKSVLEIINALLESVGATKADLGMATTEQTAGPVGPTPIGEQASDEDVEDAVENVLATVNHYAGKHLGTDFDHLGTRATVIPKLKTDIRNICMVLSNKSHAASRTAPIKEQAQEYNPLNGFSKDKAKRVLNKALKLDELNGKYFSDTSWEPINKIYGVLGKLNVDYENAKVGYEKDEKGTPTSKRWYTKISFTNDKGRPAELYLQIVAAGAGTIEDPLSRYDVVAYIS